MKNIKTLTDDQLIDELFNNTKFLSHMAIIREIEHRWKKDKEEINSYRLNHK